MGEWCYPGGLNPHPGTMHKPEHCYTGALSWHSHALIHPKAPSPELCVDPTSSLFLFLLPCSAFLSMQDPSACLRSTHFTFSGGGLAWTGPHFGYKFKSNKRAGPPNTPIHWSRRGLTPPETGDRARSQSTRQRSSLQAGFAAHQKSSGREHELLSRKKPWDAPSSFLRSLGSRGIYGCIIRKSLQRCKQGDCVSVRY